LIARVGTVVAPRLRCLAIVALAIFAAGGGPCAMALAQSRDPPDSPTVTTLAGSGAVGIADGPAAAASFVAPAGIAFDDAGRLFVADRDAQRIRIVSPSGNVSTLAGAGTMIPLGLGAVGGYRDGPAAQALFDMPAAVLPLPAGGVLVADTQNHCLRLVERGMVSTFAGTTEAGGRDGARSSARFARPVSLALDGSGDIYVADPPNGVREIDPHGNVSTLSFRDSRNVIAVSTVPGARQYVLVASVSLIQRLDTRTLNVDRPFPLQFGLGVQLDTQGAVIYREPYTNAGPVSALAAFASGDFVFTDALDSAVRLGQAKADAAETYTYTRNLTAVPPENASTGIAGFRDGPGVQALVDEPVGIALARDGRVAVADTGNRRIRLLSAFNHLTHLTLEDRDELPSEPDHREFRIALVGSSYIWWDQPWHESIAGATEDALTAAPHGKRIPRIYPVMRKGVCAAPELDLIDAELSTGVVDMVVLDLSTFGQTGGDAGNCFGADWQATLKHELVQTMADLKEGNVTLLVVNFPGSIDFPDEEAYYRIYKGQWAYNGWQTDLTHVQYYHDALAKILSDSGAPTLDLWPAFLSAYGSPNHVPLFEVWDHHLSTFGRNLIVAELTKQLLTTPGLRAGDP